MMCCQEQTYTINTMQYPEEIIKERDRINEELGNLLIFIDSFAFEDLDEEDKYLLQRQSFVMSDYLEILDERVDRI